jgi:hypothetical protein
MLEEVEQLFGRRNHDYTILGIEFSGTIPQIWFPGDRKHIAIQLGELCGTTGRTDPVTTLKLTP